MEIKKPDLPTCPVETTLFFLSTKWSALILHDLMDGPRRFNELQRSIGHISQKVLTSNLRQMEKHGLLTRTVYAEVPPRVEYELTELGASLKPVLDTLRWWGEIYSASASGTSLTGHRQPPHPQP
ncbi:helix-turn-helix domain-containing protein [Corynebacterium matruchotii]|uniref:winged helix-turn-helix transcriptional regulator n=2 Tax=Corynebacterium matruchotii TaxID=43768 RepID=UPI0028E4824D|nr:helix-turn-helix domain-containing protein [Corynebacterium matruchotii]